LKTNNDSTDLFIGSSFGSGITSVHSSEKEGMDLNSAKRVALLTQAQQSLVFGVLGTALLRDWHLGGDAQAARLAKLFDVIRLLGQPSNDHTVPVELSTRDGYAQWAPTYDAPNLMIEAEESVVHSLVPPLVQQGSIVLDAACGTGRHLAWAESLGCRTIGVDLSESMLAVASVAAPSAALLRGDLLSLPLDSRSVDLALCSLALCHVSDLLSALRELARVLRPAGTLVVSDPHGRAAYAGGQGFVGAGGVTRARFVRNYYRQAHEWFAAFRDSGFIVESCDEPHMSAIDAARHPVAEYFPEATVAALREVPYLWVWSATRRHD
jgi:ubiquinone/menaquinone biosynthesis C-methylase UbiE